MTNRRNFIKLAEGIRAAGEFDPELKQALYNAVFDRFNAGKLENAEDFNPKRFTEHALSTCPINPVRLVKHLPDVDGLIRVIVTLQDDDWLYGAYIKPGELWNDWAIPYFTARTAHELSTRHNETFAGEGLESQTLEFDEDERWLIVDPESANNFAEPENDHGIQVIVPDENGLYKFDAGWTWSVAYIASETED